MVGGLMNIASYGSENIILTGNPTKTMFKAVYHKYTNFGMQRFRLDFQGLRNLSFTQESTRKFTVKRYGDLIGDTYLVINLPDIWSPFFSENTTLPGAPGDITPYEFRWIENLGVQMIKNIVITAGGSKLQEYPGEYLYCMVQRDFNNSKKDLWKKMIGHTPELNDPANANGNVNTYPNAAITSPPLPLNIDVNPSIRGRQLYIPLDAWFCGSSKLAMPLVALQYQEIDIEITFRPLADLYTITDIQTDFGGFPAGTEIGTRISPNPNNITHQLWRFLQPPPSEAALTSEYTNRKYDWNVDIHLVANYYFLDNDERELFAKSEHKYLIRNPYFHDFFNATGSRIVDITSRDMVADYMWRFRRSDANLRNEWSNYSNWPYNNVLPIPPDVWIPAGGVITNPNAFLWTQDNTPVGANIKNILIDLGIIIGGNYREVVTRDGLYDYIEKYIRTTGNAKDGLYCYNFCLDSSQREYQPSGAMNMNKFKHVEFEYNTIEPPIDPSANIINICDASGNIIGVRKSTTDLYEYNYDLRVFEERYNVIIITSGNIGLKWAK
jgi:hypothetical protein